MKKIFTFFVAIIAWTITFLYLVAPLIASLWLKTIERNGLSEEYGILIIDLDLFTWAIGLIIIITTYNWDTDPILYLERIAKEDKWRKRGWTSIIDGSRKTIVLKKRISPICTVPVFFDSEQPWVIEILATDNEIYFLVERDLLEMISNFPLRKKISISK